ncbi:PD-(D/E)XK nuclease family protein [Pseudodesulfovibrio sp. F-1]|uniref:PD-(D/E)XK nuclease family protein n=1 Tax=Pseudodesulfovibrio alkaliphilus TaxID=2661613 RepID=A0A7K1KSF1_9BACT|nr:PD-(D/E)XK nuclease family protein [Pseudodesulfovibrio alkaliphilus]MUM78811.1 PD-(D/E)XK nuclease family protein [Pseudodesulfovibrio alkaliphilus]
MRTVTLIPWHADFIPALGRLLATRPDLGKMTVLFPHNRPRRYLKAFLRDHTDMVRPALLPRMTSIADFVAGLRRDLTNRAVTPANRLDLVELLREVVGDLRREGRGLLARLPEMDRETFLPWGLRLARLADDLMRQNAAPDNLIHMDGEVSPYAAALLEQLSAIHLRYVEALSERDWTTPGMDWRFVIANIALATEHLRDSPILAAGFYALSKAEDTLFRRLWEDGLLHPVIHSDPALATGGSPHWATAEHGQWLTRWQTRPIIPAGENTPARVPAIRFCEGFDRHSQLAALAEELASASGGEEASGLNDTAVILPDEGALMPVLHHLPVSDPNISMGYPLERTALARLVETILALQENRLDDGRYHWRDLIALIRHPYLRLLGPEDRPLRKLFHVWEAVIRTGERFLDPMAWQPPYGDPVLKDVNEAMAEPLRLTVLHHCLTPFRNAASLNDLGNALSGLAAMLHAHGEGLWHTYLVDAECLFRLTSSVVPQLRGAETSVLPLSRGTLFSMLRSMLARERVSFEPEPLAGLQVLGVLETRLLHFERLHILDAVEERLPGTNPFDPLLPDPLRRLLDLPDVRQRDNVSGYNFHRLLMGAREAVIYYQSGIRPGLLDQKSARSRYVEQLLWEREKHENRLAEPGDPLVRTVTFAAGSVPTEPRPITVTPAVREALDRTLDRRGLSPSTLDLYLNCPKRFHYEYLSNVRSVDQVAEDGDRGEFGSLVHEVLREFFTPHIGRGTDLASLDPQPLLALYEQRLRTSELFRQLPVDTRMALLMTGRHRLAAFSASQEPATLLGLEQRLETTVDVGDRSILLQGFLDRVELRSEGVMVLDYKTGSVTAPKKSFWNDDSLWTRMEQFDPADPDPALLPDLARSLRSVQLPVYLHLHARCQGETPYDAGLIKLGEDGSIDRLFGPKWTEEERTEVVGESIPLLIRTLVRHMLHAGEFAAAPSRNCDHCGFKGPCGR